VYAAQYLVHIERATQFGEGERLTRRVWKLKRRRKRKKRKRRKRQRYCPRPML
jgi:Na+/H+ antiporter NhaB